MKSRVLIWKKSELPDPRCFNARGTAGEKDIHIQCLGFHDSKLVFRCTVGGMYDDWKLDTPDGERNR